MHTALARKNQTTQRSKTPTPARAHASIRNILRRPAVQPKLKIGAANDPAEREADAVADKVMGMRLPTGGQGAAMSTPSLGPGPNPIRRLCNECEGEIKRQPIDGEKDELEVQRMTAGEGGKGAEVDEEEIVQSKERPGAAPVLSASSESAIRGLGGGAPLAATERAFFEPRFGRDFSNVRIHNDSAADQSARAINAQAYTLGEDIAFASGKYSPGSPAGRRLLAHELTHTVQQQKNGQLLQRDLARPPRGVANPIQALTPQEIQDAIAFNQARFSDPYSIRVIRDVIGLTPLPAVVDEAFVNQIAGWQARRRMTQDGKVGHFTTRTLYFELVAERGFRDAILLLMDSYNLPSDLRLHNLRVGTGANCCGPTGGADGVTFGGPHCPPVGGPVIICICRTHIPRGVADYNHFIRIVGHELIHVPQCAGGTGDVHVDEFEGFFWEACARGRTPQLAPAARVNHANIALAHFNRIPAPLRTPPRVARQAQLQALVAAGGVGPC